MRSLACHTCGAGLPLPETVGIARCEHCRTLDDDGASIDLVDEPEDAARIPMTDAAVLGLLRRHFTSADAIDLWPNVPPRKEQGARKVHADHLPPEETILALYDESLFGPTHRGFVVTSQRLCWMNATGAPRMIEWRHLDPERMYAERAALVVGAGAVEMAEGAVMIESCADVFHVLALSARERRSSRPASAAMPAPSESGVARVAKCSLPPDEGHTGSTPATRPPPHTVSYRAYAVHAAMQSGPPFSCWHCRTPLYRNTPQCARCGAWPAAHGWLRRRA